MRHICYHCGGELTRHGKEWWCDCCEDAFETEPGFAERLTDGFALLNAAEDEEIEPDKHI